MSNLRQKKKHNTHTVVEDSTQAERERREKGRESEEEEDRRLRRLPLPPFLSPTFFWEEQDVLDDERERTIDRNCDTSRLYYNLCAEREHETRARESERKREKRGGGRSTSLSLAGVLCWIA